MSIAYLDPGNIEGDLQAGAVAKYKVIHSNNSCGNNTKWNNCSSTVALGALVVYSCWFVNASESWIPF